MNIWFTLCQKELHASKIWITIHALIFTLTSIFVVILPSSSVKLVIYFSFLVIHLVYLGIWAIYSVLKEWRGNTATHWLNLPHHGFLLLSAKMFTGYLLLIISFILGHFISIFAWKLSPGLITNLFGFSIRQENWGSYFYDWLVHHSVEIILFVLTTSLSTGFLILCAVLLAKSVEKNHFLAGFGFFLAAGIIKPLFISNPVQTITEWGNISSNHQELASFVQTFGGLASSFYIGNLMIEILFTLLFIWISSKLLDQYVQA
ncbi:hypothetical protein [Thermoflavimicrobium daqui]|uniref:Uncharacterized protein n=1 Tax=Thermoflavimicrobium daqui TaxID=2137476 RepID=A0A364K663_9BACL|nr:hypothetical protein [Thermoflavimicrobium daqui]RAL25783.1 hypothetical protein DL897_06825 [Thermoflavimicrobium daqui]